MKDYYIKFTVDGIYTEMMVRAKTASDAEKIVELMFAPATVGIKCVLPLQQCEEEMGEPIKAATLAKVVSEVNGKKR